MESIMKSEIFFVVATIAVVIITIGVSVALYYVIKVARTIDALSGDIKSNVMAFGTWLRGNMFFKRFFTTAPRKSRKAKRASAPDEE